MVGGPLRGGLVRHDVDRRRLAGVRRIQRIGIKRAPDVLADLEHVGELHVGPYVAQRAAAGDLLQVGAAAADDLARHELFADHKTGRPAAGDDVAAAQHQFIVVLVTVAEMANHKIIGAQRAFAALADHDALRACIDGHVGDGRLALSEQHRPDTIARAPIVLTRHHPDAQRRAFFEAVQRERRIVLADLEPVEQPAVGVGRHRERLSAAGYLDFGFGNRGLPGVTQRHPDRPVAPAIARFLDRLLLDNPGIVDADLRPDHSIMDDAVAVAHERKRCDFTVVDQRHHVMRRRLQAFAAQHHRIACFDGFGRFAVFVDDCDTGPPRRRPGGFRRRFLGGCLGRCLGHCTSTFRWGLG